MRNRRRLIIAVALVVGLLSLAAASNASSHPTGTLDGTVLLDGEPLADVEVFLGIFPGPHNSNFEPRYTCTDSNGEFEFADVPLDHGLISAVGPQVFPAIPCDNPKFFDPTSNPQRPLVAQFYDHHNFRGFDVFSAPATIGYDVIRLPNEHPGTNNMLRQALNFCYDKVDNDKALDFFEKFKSSIDKMEAKGKLSPANAQVMRDYADVLDFNFSVGCETLVSS